MVSIYNRVSHVQIMERIGSSIDFPLTYLHTFFQGTCPSSVFEPHIGDVLELTSHVDLSSTLELGRCACDRMIMNSTVIPSLESSFHKSILDEWDQLRAWRDSVGLQCHLVVSLKNGISIKICLCRNLKKSRTSDLPLTRYSEQISCIFQFSWLTLICVYIIVCTRSVRSIYNRDILLLFHTNSGKVRRQKSIVPLLSAKW